MPASKVCFTTMRSENGESLPAKLARLAKLAGIENIDFKRKFVALKVHFGERGNLAFPRHNYARAVADLVRELGGRPFLTDANTLYVGSRRNAIDHLEVAYENGFSPLQTGCHVLITDGLKGDDEVEVPIPGGRLLQTARIGRVAMDADIIVTINHFKGHMLTGVGGAVKNVGMGCGSRAGKMAMHAKGKPTIDPDACTGCRRCQKACGEDAISFAAPARRAAIDPQKCVGCGRCLSACPVDAVESDFDAPAEDCHRRIAEYTLAVLHGRPHFHLNLAIDISPDCDCMNHNDAPILPDIGLFASPDPVAIDMACAEMAVALPPLPGSKLAECSGKGRDHFASIHPITNWRSGLEYAEAIGLGSAAYDLVRM